MRETTIEVISSTFLRVTHLWVSVDLGPVGREKCSTCSMLWVKIICIFTNTCLAYSRVVEYSSCPSLSDAGKGSEYFSLYTLVLNMERSLRLNGLRYISTCCRFSYIFPAMVKVWWSRISESGTAARKPRFKSPGQLCEPCILEQVIPSHMKCRP